MGAGLIGVWLCDMRSRQPRELMRFAEAVLFLIVSLGALKPETWTLFVVGLLVALAVATALTSVVPRLYSWSEPR